MGNHIEEYLKQFKTEQLELIVRISFCFERGYSGGFPMIENCYQARARFDMALNVKTGELLDTKAIAYNWLEWLAPKKLFGFKYRYKFQQGKQYHILVREKISEKDDKYRAYYVDEVLEKDIKEQLLAPIYDFESEFEEQTTDMIILIKNKVNGWATIADYRMPKCTFIASIDLKTNTLSPSWGTITWIEKDTRLKLKYNFKEMQVYHIKARKNKNISNSYMVCEVLKKVNDDRLERIKEGYEQPIIINNPLSKFELDRKNNWFKGELDYLGESCNVYLNVDEGETTADIQLNKLSGIYQQLEKWDADMKEYVANELLDLANDWLDDASEVTKEEFIQRIGNPDITIESDGAIHLLFDSDGIFTDHSVEVDIDKNGYFIGADIVG